ncbi:MAG: hypothetical protein HYT41_02415 [Candidatus Sungbacteria bacterium]|nr:hypothetical protein [Candidatus Sungbacteria bacterium]
MPLLAQAVLNQMKSPFNCKIERIRRELLLLFIAALLTVPLITYRDHFIRWAGQPETYDAFDTSSVHMGKYLAALPRETHKYIVVNRSGTIVRGIPMPAQTVIYITDTFREESQHEKNFTYIVADGMTSRAMALSGFNPPADKKYVIAFLDGLDGDLIAAFRAKYPKLKAHVPGDFIILENR